MCPNKLLNKRQDANITNESPLILSSDDKLFLLISYLCRMTSFPNVLSTPSQLDLQRKTILKIGFEKKHEWIFLLNTKSYILFGKVHLQYFFQPFFFILLVKEVCFRNYSISRKRREFHRNSHGWTIIFFPLFCLENLNWAGLSVWISVPSFSPQSSPQYPATS